MGDRDLDDVTLFSGLDAGVLDALAAAPDPGAFGPARSCARASRPTASSCSEQDGSTPRWCADGEVVTVGQVGCGEVVGEMALISDEPRATVVADRDSELVHIPTAAFDDLVARDPRGPRRVASHVTDRLRARCATSPSPRPAHRHPRAPGWVRRRCGVR
ncbi:MAG: cyclic nucleotide-binding domain-containing protein [Acidimicrobiales bacterium]